MFLGIPIISHLFAMTTTFTGNTTKFARKMLLFLFQQTSAQINLGICCQQMINHIERGHADGCLTLLLLLLTMTRGV